MHTERYGEDEMTLAVGSLSGIQLGELDYEKNTPFYVDVNEVGLM